MYSFFSESIGFYYALITVALCIIFYILIKNWLLLYKQEKESIKKALQNAQDGLFLNKSENSLSYQGVFKKVNKQTVSKSNININNNLDNNDVVNLKVRSLNKNNKNKKLEVQNIENYYFLDLTSRSEMLRILKHSNVQEKRLFNIFFDNLNTTYRQIKLSHPNYKVELLLIAKDKNGVFGNLFEKFNSLIPQNTLSQFDFFDNNSFVIISGIREIIPFLYKDKKRKIKLDKININKIISSLSISDEQIDNNPETEKEINTITSKNIKNKANLAAKKIIKQAFDVSQIKKPTDNALIKLLSDIKNISSTSKITTKGELKSGINQRKMSAVLRKYKIKDPDIIATVRVALEEYIKEKGKKLTSEEANVIILKAINYSIHGKEEIDEEYLKNPALLFEKLSTVRTHKTKLDFPKLDDKIPIKPKDIIPINHTTGVWRQKQEFAKTIHKNIKKLFSTLEQFSEYPIKIKKIEHEVIDNELTRYINYTITLQNLSGGDDKPYTIEMKVPASVNDRYFKLNGSTYIMSTQHMLKPVTKTAKDEVRILSNYAIVTIKIKNLKFNPADIDEILNYVNVRYPKLIKVLNNDKCEFSDHSTIYLTGKKVYSSIRREIITDPETGSLIDLKSEKQIENKRKAEFLFTIILDKIKQINPDDKLTRTKKTIPFFIIYIGGFKIPLILYYWQLKGLMTTLNDFGIDYEIIDSKKEIAGSIFIEMTNSKFLVIKPKKNDIREQLIVNGILSARIKKKFNDVEDIEEIQAWIDQNYGSKSVLNMRLLTQNTIDPVTRELLEFENLPTKFPRLVSDHCLDKLLNQKPDSLADLKIYRARLSEVILNIMYKQLTLSHNHYSKKVEFGNKKARLAIDPDYIMKEIIGSGMLQHTEPTNPVDEIFFASKTLKSGPGGVPKKNMFKPEHRNIHPSHYGNMSATTTSEYGDVGLTVSHTITPQIINEYGSYGIKDIKTISNFGALSVNDGLIPFQNEMDSGRLIMATTHTKQVTPTDGCEVPFVGTGMEYIVPQISSSRFVQKASKDGEIIEVEKNKTMTVKYKDGSKETFDILPRLSRKQ